MSLLRRRCVGLVLLSAMAVSLAACGDDGGGSSQSGVPAYEQPGPYPIGVTTLDLPDRKVEVWYPAIPGSEAGVALDTYRQTDPITDPLLKQFAEGIARRKMINLVYTTRARRGLPISKDGPFPLLVFSHGFGGWRAVNSALAAGIASWGFVVASADYLERGLNAVATNNVMASAELDQRITSDTIALMKQHASTASDLFAGGIDFERIGIAGHSAGGRTAIDALANPEVDVAIGYAAAGGAVNDGKPVMMITARGDIGVTHAASTRLYDSLQAPKRWLTIETTGHNSFSDICTPIREGASLAQLAREAGLQIDERLLALAEDGCASENLSPEATWGISQHLTVAQLRETFGIDRRPVGLGAEIAEAFAAPLEYVFE